MVVEIFNTPKLVKINFNDELKEEPVEDLEEDQKEDPELREHQADHGI